MITGMRKSKILENLIKKDFGLVYNSGRWARSKVHDSLVYDREKGLFYWNSRGIYGDLNTYLRRVRNNSVDTESISRFIPVESYENNYKVMVYQPLMYIFHEQGKDKDKRTFFYERGLNDETIDRFLLGYFKGFYTIPFTENGILKNIMLRGDNPKRFFSYYKNIGPLLYNPDILKFVSEIYITEGPIDALRLIQEGLPAISTNCGSCFLSNWIAKFSNIREVYILLDNDSAGIVGAKKISRFLGTTRCKVYCFWDFNKKGYDPVDFFREGHTKEELLNIIKNRSKYPFEL